MNQACIEHARKIRELNKARQQKQALRQARKEARAAGRVHKARRSDKSAGFTCVQYVSGLGPEFYLTREWRNVRYRALKRHGGQCQCCGAKDGPLHVDHIKPRSRFPELELELGNLQVLCAACNIGKGASDVTDWRSK